MTLRDCDCGHWTGCDAKVTGEALIGELVKRGVLEHQERIIGEVVDYKLTGRDYVEGRVASEWRYLREET